MGHLLGDSRYLAAAEQTLRAAWLGVEKYPQAHMSTAHRAGGASEPSGDDHPARGRGADHETWRRDLRETLRPPPRSARGADDRPGLATGAGRERPRRSARSRRLRLQRKTVLGAHGVTERSREPPARRLQGYLYGNSVAPVVEVPRRDRPMRRQRLQVPPGAGELTVRLNGIHARQRDQLAHGGAQFATDNDTSAGDFGQLSRWTACGSRARLPRLVSERVQPDFDELPGRRRAAPKACCTTGSLVSGAPAPGTFFDVCKRGKIIQRVPRNPERDGRNRVTPSPYSTASGTEHPARAARIQ